MSSCDNDFSEALLSKAAQSVGPARASERKMAMENMQTSPSVNAILTTVRQKKNGEDWWR
jgi:hypothetical protein